jgi:hypothetical protein
MVACAADRTSLNFLLWVRALSALVVREYLVLSITSISH